jgi:cytochrome c nitrite reductase small subunit
MRKLFSFLKPPPGWILAVNLVIALLVGMFFYVSYVSNALSYLSDAPETCVNCHVMRTQYATWQHSSHREVAACNDCHVPQDNVFRKYLFKAQDGMRHAYMFTFRLEPQVIRMHEAGVSVVQENCIACHEKTNRDTRLSGITAEVASHGGGKLCWQCHRETPHSSVRSLVSTPYARTPVLPSPVPEWLQKMTNTK